MPSDEQLDAENLKIEHQQAVTDAVAKGEPPPTLAQYVEATNPLIQYAKQAGLQGPGTNEPPGFGGTSQKPPSPQGPQPPGASALAPGDVIDLPVIGGGWGSTISPGARQEFESAFADTSQTGIEGTHRIMEAARKADAIRRDATDRTIQELSDDAGRAEGEMFFKKNEEQKAKRIKEESDAEVRQAQEELRNQPAPDPNKYFNDMKDWQKISLAINVGLGAMAAAYIGGPNQALEITRDAVARSLKAQENEYAAKKGNVDNALARNLRMTGDLDKARELTRIQMLELVKLQSAKRATEIGSAVAMANHEKLLAGLQTEGDMAQSNLTMKHAELRARTETYRAPTVLGGGLLSQAEKDNPLYVPGLGGLAPTEKEAQELRTKSGNLQALQDSILTAASIRGEMSRMRSSAASTTDLFKDQKYLQLQSAFQAAVTQANVALGQGAISGEDAKRANVIVGDMQNPKLSGEDVQNAAVEINNMFGRQFEQLRKTGNITPVQVKQVRDPRTGIIQRVFPRTGEVTASPQLQQTTDAKLKPTVPQPQ